MFELMNCRRHLGHVQSGREVTDDRLVITLSHLTTSHRFRLLLCAMIKFTRRNEKHAVPRSNDMLARPMVLTTRSAYLSLYIDLEDVTASVNITDALPLGDSWGEGLSVGHPS